MHPNENALKSISQGYSDKIAALSQATSTLGKDLKSAKTPDRKAYLNRKLSENARSKLPNLYKNIKKNADILASSKGNIFPVAIQHQNENGQHQFSNMPSFSSVFNQVWPTIHTIGQLQPSREVQSGGKIHTVTPCFTTSGHGETESEYLEEKPPTADLRHVDIPEVSQNTIDHCNQAHCHDCSDCQPHQSELIKSVRGMFDHSSEDADGVRGVHIKNLITTLNSWANHQRSRGNDEKTCTDRTYEPDARQHESLATAMSIAAHRLHRAYENDYFSSNGAGGGVHRDISEHGDNKEIY